MILIHNNNKIVSIIMESERNPNADYSSYIEIDEISPNKSIIKELLFAQTDLTPYTISDGNLLKNEVLVPIEIDLDKQQLRTEYIAAIARLQQIENATNPTNAQIIAAIRDIAKYERLLLKVLSKTIN